MNCTIQEIEGGTLQLQCDDIQEIDGINYSSVLSPEGITMVIIVITWFFCWILERIFYYITYRVKKTYYDD